MVFGSCGTDSKNEKNNTLAADTEPPLPAGWNHQAYLKSSNNSDTDYFGYSVACDGDTVVIGAYEEDSSTNFIIHGVDLYLTNDLSWTNGAVYVYRRIGTTWVQEAYLKAPTPINMGGGGDQFGYSVAISGNTIVAGAPGEDSNTTAIINGSDLSSTNNSVESTGAAYVFVRDANNMWSHQAYLKSPNAETNDNFGMSVAVSGDTAIVGASGEDSASGAAYVFVRSGTTWSHQAYLKAPNAGNNDNFGISVAVSGDTAVAGAPAEDSNTTAIINGSTLGLPADTGANINTGAAYVFIRSGITWTHQAYLKAPNAGSNDYFGQSVAIDGETVVVGAMYEDSSTTAIINGDDLSSTNNYAINYNSGAAYVFTRSGTAWSHQAYLKAPVPASTNTNNAYTNANDEFGHSVAISGDHIIVGAHYEDSSTMAIINGSDLTGINEYGNQNGAAYVFGRSESTWTMEGYLKAPNSTQQDEFGNAVGISDATVVVGARYEDSRGKSVINGTDLSAAINDGSQNGAAYVYYFNADE